MVGGVSLSNLPVTACIGILLQQSRDRLCMEV